MFLHPRPSLKPGQAPSSASSVTRVAGEPSASSQTAPKCCSTTTRARRWRSCGRRRQRPALMFSTTTCGEVPATRIPIRPCGTSAPLRPSWPRRQMARTIQRSFRCSGSERTSSSGGGRPGSKSLRSRRAMKGWSGTNHRNRLTTWRASSARALRTPREAGPPSPCAVSDGCSATGYLIQPFQRQRIEQPAQHVRRHPGSFSITSF